jgi:hypothetical protein
MSNLKEVHNSKPERLRLRKIAALLLALCGATGVNAQTNYTVNWWKIAGSGSNTGGVYTATSTVGQTDAGTLSGGAFTVQGGFWGVLAVIQTPGAPLLTIALTSTNTAIVSWPAPSTGWSPQQTLSLDIPNWAAPPDSVNDNGTNKFIIVNPHTGNRFFRLAK